MRPETLIDKYRTLRAAYDRGQLSEERFAASCEQLMSEDQDGRWWSVDAAGTLSYYDDASGQWVAHGDAGIGAGPATGGKSAGRTGAARAGRSAQPDRSARSHQRPESEARPSSAADTGPSSAVPPIEAVGGGLVLVFFVSLVLSWIGWDLLKIVPVAINSVIPTGSCTSFSAGSLGMYFCSAFVGLRVVFGSLVLAVVLLMFRKPISAVIKKINQGVPQQHRSLMPAIVAALFFAVVWAGSHDATGDLWGILPHRAFPALVGVFVHLTMSYGPSVIARFSGFFAARDRLGMLTRWGLVFIIPTVVSLAITMQDRVSNEAFKQQFVVLIGMLGAFIIMTPRSGRLSDIAQQAGRRSRKG